MNVFSYGFIFVFNLRGKLKTTPWVFQSGYLGSQSGDFSVTQISVFRFAKWRT